MVAVDLPVFSCFADIMARTIVSNAEFLARAKTPRREEDAAEEVAPLQSVLVALRQLLLLLPLPRPAPQAAPPGHASS
ncbi:hypothetical protein DEO72_LG10g3081 [Vigna unguiculata]|uniref:Uncharacterized protein n=1 Tax=Vigna unguiculata TaxID=3917 RepID=A0A4D6NDB8_VIGUN|nr:hypothetical protein DEO72_LG10g3081 [Vigna unguiculata]